MYGKKELQQDAVPLNPVEHTASSTNEKEVLAALVSLRM